ncbi:MDR family MFS transporter [Alteribacillus iranensis]|uniref:MFS transporter, DHA2 family, multidrug resistance protein n=1 Tax=Alteribacillus iranensis TaxID=930128 RepID=A0A1I2CH07_9BACI|nr:MDR family MFS transporter [Alteribacillus iranensis]SFE67637.1 MFS transporter, DHA2 family, multidrug resistance protein [Alteribacillus iranensis]
MTDDTHSSSWGLPPRQKGAMIAALLTGAFMGIINETLLATALPSIQKAFSISQSEVQWLTTAFLMVNGIMIPISAFLIERFSTRQLFLTAIGLFGMGTAIAALAPTFTVLLLGRVVQATGSGIMLPLLMTVLLAVISVERRGTAMGMIGIVIAFGPAIGPTLSGWLLAHFTWRSLFITVLPVVVITILVAYLFLRNVTELRKPKIDVLSIILSTLGFGSFLYGFSVLSEKGWNSPIVIASIATGAIVISLFVWRQFSLDTPMLEFRVFKFPMFTMSIAITMAVLVSLIGAETLLPLFMQNVLHFSPLESGLMLLPGAIVIGAMSPITGRLFDRFGAKWLAIIGLTVVTITTFMFTRISLETTFTYLTIIYAIRMFGLSFALMPVMTSALNQLPPKWYAHGSALANTLQQISASIGTAILVTLVALGTQRFAPTTAVPEENFQLLAEISGYKWAFMGSTLLAFVALIIALFLHPPSKEREIVKQLHKKV